jgi:hypothetical protein
VCLAGENIGLDAFINGTDICSVPSIAPANSGKSVCDFLIFL